MRKYPAVAVLGKENMGADLKRNRNWLGLWYLLRPSNCFLNLNSERHTLPPSYPKLCHRILNTGLKILNALAYINMFAMILSYSFARH